MSVSESISLLNETEVSRNSVGFVPRHCDAETRTQTRRQADTSPKCIYLWAHFWQVEIACFRIPCERIPAVSLTSSTLPRDTNLFPS
jgi:hypothetical protein